MKWEKNKVRISYEIIDSATKSGVMSQNGDNQSEHRKKKTVSTFNLLISIYNY